MATLRLTREAIRQLMAIAPNAGSPTDVVAVWNIDLEASLAETTGEGALASLDTVGTSQIDNDAVTAAKIGDAELKAIGGLTSAADKGIYFTGSGTAAVYDLNASGRALGGVSGAANKLPYFTGAGTAALADFSASGRAVANLTGAADKGVYFTGDGTATTYDLNASGRALGGVSGAADKVPYFTGAGTAALADFTSAARTMVALSNVVGLKSTTVALTDAQVKALPTTPVTVVAAPAAGYAVVALSVVLICNAAAGAYTNIDGAATIGIDGVVGLDEAGTSTVTHLLGSAASRAALFYPVTLSNLPTSALDGAALTITATNAAAGNFTGGNAANTLAVTVLYVTVAV